MYAGHLDLTCPLVWEVDAALSTTRCDQYIQKLRQHQQEQAPVITREGVEVDLKVRDNTRVMWDDEAEANELLSLVKSTVPEKLLGKALKGGNPRLRLYRYQPGQHHAAHWDTVVELPGGVQSLLTLVFYLNDDFEGGQTDFPELRKTVTPRKGRALLFQHRVLHEACRVLSGEKYVLRTDILYR